MLFKFVKSSRAKLCPQLVILPSAWSLIKPLSKLILHVHVGKVSIRLLYGLEAVLLHAHKCN